MGYILILTMMFAGLSYISFFALLSCDNKAKNKIKLGGLVLLQFEKCCFFFFFQISSSSLTATSCLGHLIGPCLKLLIHSPTHIDI